jgi:hypothetical protein
MNTFRHRLSLRLTHQAAARHARHARRARRRNRGKQPQVDTATTTSINQKKISSSDGPAALQQNKGAGPPDKSR